MPESKGMAATATAEHGIVQALRDAAPYIAAHRGKVVVAALPGSLLRSDGIRELLGDITLLARLAELKFALAFDALPRAAQIGEEKGLDPALFRPGAIAVDDAMLECLRQAVREMRELLEGGLAMDIPGLKGIGTATGEPFASRRAGVIEGTDTAGMGVPKPIASQEAADMLQAGKVVLLPPLGIDRSGATLHLDSLAVAAAFSAACAADKLVVFVDKPTVDSLDFRELALAETRERLAGFSGAARQLVQLGVEAIENGVERVHYLDSSVFSGLLLELLTPDGVAAMISRDKFDAVRPATSDDAAGIAELIKPGVAAGSLLPRSFDKIVQEADRYAVVSRDDALIACASLERFGDRAEFGCLAVRPAYANQSYGALLLDFFEDKASKEGVAELLVISTQAGDWFRERGFADADLDKLPEERRRSVADRRAQVLAKKLA